MKWLVLFAVAATAILSALITVGVRRVARSRRFVDRPGGHKEHARPVALGGGVALYWAVALPALAGALLARWADGLASLPAWWPDALAVHVPGMAAKLDELLAILGGGLVLHAVGLFDDARPLAVWKKLIAQVAVGLFIAVVVGIRAAEFMPAPLSVAATVVWIVLVVNAFNFLDNVDGLSAGVAIIAAGIFAATAMRAGQIFVPMMAWTVAGAALGFLLFNFPPASVFMGDAGSMVLGYYLAVLTVMTTYYDPGQQLQPVGVLAPLVVLAVPLYDVISVCVIRLRAGDSPFRADRRHFSHRLIRRGMNTRAAVMTIYLATAATALSALLLPIADRVTAMLVFGQTLCIVLIIALLEREPRGPSTTPIRADD